LGEKLNTGGKHREYRPGSYGKLLQPGGVLVEMCGLLPLGSQYLDGVDPLNGFVEDPLYFAPRGPLSLRIKTHNSVEDGHEDRGKAHDAKAARVSEAGQK